MTSVSTNSEFLFHIDIYSRSLLSIQFQLLIRIDQFHVSFINLVLIFHDLLRMNDSLLTPEIDLDTEKVGFFGQIEYNFLRNFHKKNPVKNFERLPDWWEPETPGSRGLSSMGSWDHKDTVFIRDSNSNSNYKR